MFLRRRPDEQQIAAFLEHASDSRLTYQPAGLSELSPRGYNVDEHRARIGTGPGVLERAKAAIDSWAPFQLGWAKFYPTAASPGVGVDVAIAVKHLGFWSLNACRVVARLPAAAGDTRYGFAYGTLEQHAESGEELFSVELDPSDGAVWYQIRAVSRPRASLAKLGYPISRRLQKKFRDDSVKVMKRDVGNRTGYQLAAAPDASSARAG